LNWNTKVNSAIEQNHTSENQDHAKYYRWLQKRRCAKNCTPPV